MNLTFDHIALETNDVSEAVDFYRATFKNVEVLYQDSTWAFLTVAGTKIAFVAPGEHPPHLCFRVETHEELERLAGKYQKKIKLHRDRSESFYFSDPSGNAIEILWYP